MNNKKSPLIIIGAMECEVSLIENLLADRKRSSLFGFPLTCGTLYDQPVTVARTKVGMVNTAMLSSLLIDKLAPCCIISQGTAGSHREDIHTNDIVLGSSLRSINNIRMTQEDCRELERISSGEWSAEQTYFSDPALLDLVEAIPYVHGRLIRGVIGSGDFWTHGYEDIRAIRERHGTFCEEMESFAAAQVCAEMTVPFLCFRIISNNELTGENFDPAAAEHCQRFTAEVIKCTAAHFFA